MANYQTLTLSICGKHLSIDVGDQSTAAFLRNVLHRSIVSNRDNFDFHFVIDDGLPPKRPPNTNRFNFCDPQNDGDSVWAFYWDAGARVDERKRCAVLYPGVRDNSLFHLFHIVVCEMLFGQSVAVPLHASCVACGPCACVFVAPSGGGKTTVAALREDRCLVHNEAIYLSYPDKEDIRAFPGIADCQNGDGPVDTQGPILNKIALLQKSESPCVRLTPAHESAQAIVFSILTHLPMSRRIVSRRNKALQCAFHLMNQVPVVTMDFRQDTSFWPHLCNRESACVV